MTLRYYFPKVPIMTVSVILVSNILGYIGEFLYFYTLIYFYKQSPDYQNII